MLNNEKIFIQLTSYFTFPLLCKFSFGHVDWNNFSNSEILEENLLLVFLESLYALYTALFIMLGHCILKILTYPIMTDDSLLLLLLPPLKANSGRLVALTGGT